MEKLDPIKLHMMHFVDPIEVFSKDDGALSYSGGELSAPTFFMGDKLPEKAKALQEIVRSADCYLIISPEYNHSIPPALLVVVYISVSQVVLLHIVPVHSLV